MPDEKLIQAAVAAGEAARIGDDDKWGDSGGWVLSKHGIRDSHVPEVFPHVEFSTREVPAGQAAVPAPVPAASR